MPNDNSQTTSREREILLRTGLKFWKGKTLSKMTNEECKECLQHIEKTTGTYYVI